MIRIDSNKNELEVSGDILTLSSELGYTIGELKTSGVPIEVIASAVFSFLIIKCNKEERLKFFESIQQMLNSK